MNLTVWLSGANLIALLLIYGKLTIMGYQHKLMWADFARKKDINGNGLARRAGAE